LRPPALQTTHQRPTMTQQLGRMPHLVTTQLVAVWALALLDHCQAACYGPQVEFSDTICQNIAEGSTCSYQCSYGYYSNGDAHTCGSNGQLSGGLCNPLNCYLGTRVENAATSCSGFVADVCNYQCNSGYEKGADHVCQPSRRWTGGSCNPAPCTSGLTLVGSTAECPTGQAPGTVCPYSCNAGYTKGGTHMCRTSGAFYGGACTATPCNSGLTIERSPTTCSGATDDVCSFSCNSGYVVTGTHICRASSAFTGGSCEPQPCSSGLTLPGSDTQCSGVTAAVCSYSCRSGFTKGGTHTCGINAVFSGGSCTAIPCNSGLTMANSDTTCNGSTEDQCTFQCNAGYTVSGSHSCQADQSFSGGSCAGIACTTGNEVHATGSPTVCEGVTGEECNYECHAGAITRTVTRVCSNRVTSMLICRLCRKWPTYLRCESSVFWWLVRGTTVYRRFEA
jgi:CUB/sushi domain-containing protein